MCVHVEGATVGLFLHAQVQYFLYFLKTHPIDYSSMFFVFMQQAMFSSRGGRDLCNKLNHAVVNNNAGDSEN